MQGPGSLPIASGPGGLRWGPEPALEPAARETGTRVSLGPHAEVAASAVIHGLGETLGPRLPPSGLLCCMGPTGHESRFCSMNACLYF